MLTKNYATGLAFLVIACCGNGHWILNAAMGALSLLYMNAGRKEASDA
ncbi:hypothetical protein [Stenotrophomonas sp. NLF4-10]|nr:hypothetical protein [Stenotrophomonas sp. NLF4-10]MCG8275365.1 hypothetical protein [Stenotrophomonas sp. NLF4-10]